MRLDNSRAELPANISLRCITVSKHRCTFSLRTCDGPITRFQIIFLKAV